MNFILTISSDRVFDKLVRFSELVKRSRIGEAHITLNYAAAFMAIKQLESCWRFRKFLDVLVPFGIRISDYTTIPTEKLLCVMIINLLRVSEDNFIAYKFISC